MTTKNIKAYILALLTYDRKTNTSKFTLKDLEEYAKTRYITKDIARVLEDNTGLKFFITDDEFREKAGSGKAIGVAVITSFAYNNGVFLVKWNSDFAPLMFREGEEKDKFTLVDYGLASDMDSKSFALYEYLMMATKDGNHVVNLSIEEVKAITKSNGKTYSKYKYLNDFVLKKVAEVFEKKSNIIIGYNPVREGRQVTGVSITVAKNPNFDGIITEKQFDTLSSLKVQQEHLLAHAVNEEEQTQIKNNLSMLENLSMLTKRQASSIINVLTHRMKKTQSLSTNVSQEDEPISEEQGQYDDILSEHFWLPIENSQRKEVETVLNDFETGIREDLLNLALDYTKANKANVTTLAYTLTILKNWRQEQLKTVAECKDYQEKKYPELSHKVRMEEYKYLKDIVVSQDFLDAMSIWED